MDKFEEKLRQYILENGIRAEHLIFKASCHSVEEATAAAGASSDEFVKNICLVGPDGELVVTVIRGDDRVSTKKVAGILGMEKVKMATPEEILDKSGFPCGGTPSFGFAAVFLVDRRVLDMPRVFTGGGLQTSLVRTAPAVILEANSATVADVIR